MKDDIIAGHPFTVGLVTWKTCIHRNGVMTASADGFSAVTGISYEQLRATAATAVSRSKAKVAVHFTYLNYQVPGFRVTSAIATGLHAASRKVLAFIDGRAVQLSELEAGIYPPMSADERSELRRLAISEHEAHKAVQAFARSHAFPEGGLGPAVQAAIDAKLREQAGEQDREEVPPAQNAEDWFRAVGEEAGRQHG